MPTTANFSLEYPDDNSSVDIAGHFETLADDVDTAINTRLALTGGTLTGALVGTLTTDSSSSTTGAFKTAGGMGIAKALYVGTTLNVTGATTLTGDLTISKASATHTISSSSGTTNVNLDSVAGTYKYLNFRTGTSARWTLGTTATAESGSNAGTDLFIGRSSDGGAYIDAPLTITRSTGKTTLGSVGATAGLELGTSGPRVMSGTGSPESVVTAPIGSIWFQSDSTVGVTHWKKASGAGNTGWVVMSGDTGVRQLYSWTTPHANTTVTYFQVRRVGSAVTLYYYQSTSTSVNDVLMFDALPVGFRPAYQIQGIRNRGGILSSGDQIVWDIRSNGQVYYSSAGASTMSGQVTWETTNDWPTSLPGSAA